MQKERSKEGSTRRSNSRSTPLPGLRNARKRQGLTQRELAALAGTGAGAISDLEIGRRGSYPRTTRRLADALKTDIAALIKE